MNKKYILYILIFAFIAILAIYSKSYAADLDEILNYEVTVDPRMNDGTLDITYEITWRVLDSTTEGPLEWVQIGTPNDNFDTPTALTDNIRSIKSYNGSYVRIDFDKKYYAEDIITFKYRIHQLYMYKLSWGKCQYSFTPAWFTNAKIDNMTVRWNMDEVKSSNSKSREGNYLVWNKRNMAKGEKLKTSVKYDESAFGYLNKYRQSKDAKRTKSSNSYNSMTIMIVSIIILIILLSIFGGGGGYYGHRGFYGGYHYHGGCVHSSCACASSCASSCACACAGSGRAGCSKKDFYGTKISKDKLKDALK